MPAWDGNWIEKTQATLPFPNDTSHYATVVYIAMFGTKKDLVTFFTNQPSVLVKRQTLSIPLENRG